MIKCSINGGLCLHLVSKLIKKKPWGQQQKNISHFFSKLGRSPISFLAWNFFWYFWNLKFFLVFSQKANKNVVMRGLYIPCTWRWKTKAYFSLNFSWLLLLTWFLSSWVNGENIKNIEYFRGWFWIATHDQYWKVSVCGYLATDWCWHQGEIYNWRDL